MSNDQIEPLLRHIPIFKTFDDAKLSQLVRASSIVEFKANSIIFSEGDIGDALYVILYGGIRILTEKNGQEIILADLGIGDFFGERALLTKPKEFGATAVANDHSSLLKIRSETFYQLSQKSDYISNYPQNLRKEQVCQELSKQPHLLSPLSILFSKDQLEWLQEENYQAGDVIFHEGDTADCFYLIDEGTVKVTKKQGNEVVLLATLGRGNHFGELAFVQNIPRTATVTADTPVKLTGLKGERFLALYTQSPEIKEYVECLTNLYNLPGELALTLHRSKLNRGKLNDCDCVTAIYNSRQGVVISATRIIGEHFFSVERLDAPNKTSLHYQPGTANHRQIFLEKNYLAGATVLGDWPDLGRALQEIIQRKKIYFWQRALFRSQGELWLTSKTNNALASEVICHCTNTSLGTLTHAMKHGCDTVSKLAEKTGSSLVCGSCTAKLERIVGHSELALADVVGIIPVTGRVKSFRLRPRNKAVMPYTPGQHIRIEAQIDGDWIERTYTLTSPCRERDYYEITVQREEHGLMSRWLHDRLTENVAIRISEPRGIFCLSQASAPVVFFCGGIGITPALAMMRSWQVENSGRILHLEYSASSANDFAYRDELENIISQYPTISLSLRNSQQDGRLSASDINQLVASYTDAQFYLCGSAAYEKTVTGYLKQAGVADERIHVEHFAPPAGKTASLTQNKGLRFLAGSSVLVLMLALVFVFLPPLPSPSSVQQASFVLFWRDSVWQQFLGYTMLGLALTGMLISLRKRVRKVHFGAYSWWRVLHATTGLLAVILLVLHTGLQTTTHNNLLLLICFLGSLTLGALTALSICLENVVPHTAINRLRKYQAYLHIVVAWPLPILLGIHILSVYYF